MTNVMNMMCGCSKYLMEADRISSAMLQILPFIFFLFLCYIDFPH